MICSLPAAFVDPASSGCHAMAMNLAWTVPTCILSYRCLAQKVGLAAEKHWKAYSLTLAIQVRSAHLCVIPCPPPDLRCTHRITLQ